MKASEVKVNSLLWCERLGKFGTVIRKEQFMCLVLFNGVGSLWIHPVELSDHSSEVVKIDIKV